MNIEEFEKFAVEALDSSVKNKDCTIIRRAWGSSVRGKLLCGCLMTICVRHKFGERAAIRFAENEGQAEYFAGMFDVTENQAEALHLGWDIADNKDFPIEVTVSRLSIKESEWLFLANRLRKKYLPDG